jgi:hypothetical protein
MIVLNEEVEDKIWIGSFDIGKKNFAFCIEEVDINKIKRIKSIDVNKRYNEDHTVTELMKITLDDLYKTGKLVLHKNNDLTEGVEEGKYYDYEYCYNMTKVLDEYLKLWDKCSIIIIEEQMSFRGKINPMALKLGQHCFSYFAINYGKHKIIKVFPSYHKTNVLGAPKTKTTTKKGTIKWKTLGDKERKTWSVELVKYILEKRNETESLDIFKKQDRKKGVKKVKLDDLADVVVQLQAFKYLYFIDKI